MSTHSSESVQFIFLFLLGGPFAVVWGMKRLLIKREIENMPTSKVRSAAMGRVELAGIARQRKPQKSPLSSLDTCWWRCRIQEYRRSGKHSRWVTLRTVGSIDPFFLEDSTGRVLVNPNNAELHVMHRTVELNAGTRTTLSPLLRSWGIDDLNWIGFSKSLRILEESLPDCAPIYILGSLAMTVDHLVDRQTQLRARLRQAKENPAIMQELDLNKDGSVDAHEWDAFRCEQEEQFLKEELAKPARAPEENMIVQAPDSGTFLIATGTQEELAGRFGWLIPLSLLCGLAFSGVGVYWGLADRWSPLFIVGLVGVGGALGLLLKPKGVRIWDS